MNQRVKSLFLLFGSVILIASAARVQFVPGGVSSAGLTNLVPDVALRYHWADCFANDLVNVAALVASLDTGEPYIGLIGDSTFLILASPSVDAGTAQCMRPALAFQPAAGDPAKLGTICYDDRGLA